MSHLVLRAVDSFPEPAFSALSREAFADYEPSKLLTDVLDFEAASLRGGPSIELGFFVSGFEYSEVDGPLVRLTSPHRP